MCHLQFLLSMPYTFQTTCSLLSLWLIYSWVHYYLGAFINGISFPVAQMVKHLPAMWETRVRSLGWDDPLEKEMATHLSTLAWKIPWTEEPNRLQSMGSQRVEHDWVTSQNSKCLDECLDSGWSKEQGKATVEYWGQMILWFKYSTHYELSFNHGGNSTWGGIQNMTA